MKYLFLLISSFTFAQQTQFVDFKSVLGKIAINATAKSISGDVNYDFEVLKPIDTIKIDAQNMEFSDLKLNGNPINYRNTNKELQIIFPFKKGNNQLTFHYQAKPKQTLYFVGSAAADDLQIWTQGQGKYSSHWFPSFDDVNEKVVFSLEIAFDKDYQVISNGILKAKSEINGILTWSYKMQKPMSSYLLMLAIGKFEKNVQKSKSGIPLEMYFEPKDTDKLEPTYRYSKRMFDFLEKEIGMKYPWKIYKQNPVRDFLYAGMENTSATLFSSRYVVDSIGFEDRNYINVNAHELAHQWFGDLVTAQSGKHHWLQEGFATYYALLAEREIFGEDYFYSKLYESAQQIKYASRTDTIPVLNEKASSLSFYQKGAWTLFALHEAIGDKAFKKAVRNYLKKNAFKTVTTQDFWDEINRVSDFDTNNFSKVWLESSVADSQEINKLLNKNKAMKLLFEVEQAKKKTLAEKEEFFVEILKSKAYSAIKEAVVGQLKNEKFEAKKQLLELALETKNIQVRQAVAASLSKIPEDFRLQYESLLDDRSYQTQEIALYNLWNNFPEFRIDYLDRSKDWIGFNDFNLKTLWLSLSISTPNYTVDKEKLIKELVQYSSPAFEAITRQNALEKLVSFKLIDDDVLKNLVNATTHHMWQFSKYGRDTIRTLLKNKEWRTSFERIMPDLNEKEQFQLNRLLN
ncbi:M1 family metallopeptidase [Flavobacterium granuli]|uniref:Aminopeptidase N n=1 Tax=Flavobacterium granuli TaxID=280093 RepID=A0A1M5TNZ7_9FLAO|nr:M1 family metallopeptidase [Flavobacterium granuli]PRZ19816.1 aminopeptidase N [Flavobacterium granuli]SHH52419.1 aminopeptidase N [Flavobacterium granuli]